MNNANLSRRPRFAEFGLLAGLVLLLSAFGCGAGGTGHAGAGDGGSGGPTTVPTFDAARAFADLVAQVDFGPRNPGSAGHEACRQWLLARLQAHSGDAVEQPFSFAAATGTTFELANLLARFQGTRQVGDPLLLCAHWDTRPVADQDPDPNLRNQPILGANDGASGVAVLLELARHFQATPPPRTIIIAFFDLEDSGLTELTVGQPYSGFSIGARYFASNMGRFAPEEAVLLDMVADAHPHYPREPNSVNAAPTLVDVLWRTGQQLGFSAFSDSVGPAITDDHLPLIAAGVPAVDIIDFDYPGPNRHAYWHTTQDTPANCSPAGLQATGQTLLQFIYGN